MKIKFIPQNLEFEIKPNQSVLHAAQEHGVHIQSVCRGVPSCAECRVNIAEGEYNVLPPNAAELSLIGSAHFVDRRRLSCQLKCFGDVVIDLTEQVEKEAMVASRKKPKGRGNKDFDPEKSHAVHGNIILDQETHGTPLGAAPSSDSTKGPKKVYEEDLSTAEDMLFEQETRAALERIKNQKQRREPPNHSQKSPVPVKLKGDGENK